MPLYNTAGDHWCMKGIKNIEPCGFSKVFICLGQSCNFKLYYSSPTVFRVQGIDRCAFVSEREYHRRVRNKQALGVIKEDVTLRPMDVVNLIIIQTSMTESEKKTSHQCLASSFNEWSEASRDSERSCSRRIQICHNKHVDVDRNRFLIYDGGTDDPEAESSRFCDVWHEKPRCNRK